MTYYSSVSSLVLDLCIIQTFCFVLFTGENSSYSRSFQCAKVLLMVSLPDENVEYVSFAN